MAGYDFNVQPAQIESPLGAYGKVMQIKQAQQGYQVGQVELQQKQQELKDDQTFRASMQDPSLRGKTIGEVADTLAASGSLSPQGWARYKQLDITQRKDTAALTTTELDNRAKAHAATQELYNNVMNTPVPPDQPLPNWPQVAQQYNSIPGNQKMPLDPNQPQSKQQLQQFAPLLDMNSAYLSQEMAKRQAAATATKDEADAKIKTAEAASMQNGGMNQAMADTKYRTLQQSLASGQSIGDGDKAFIKAYEKQKLLVPVASANIRGAGAEQAREYPVINKQTGELEMRNAADINASHGNFAPAGEGAKAMGKTALIEDIRGNINQVRQSLSNPKMPEFTAGQRSEIALALGGPTPSTAISAAFRGAVLNALTPEQQDYLINLAQLKENAMAMRSVLGAGQGSEDMRSAISATIPGPNTPTKDYAGKQLDKFEAVLNRLGKGVPSMKPSGNSSPTLTNQNQGAGQGGSDPFSQFGGVKH